jgi:hypothetical protein
MLSHAERSFWAGFGVFGQTVFFRQSRVKGKKRFGVAAGCHAVWIAPLRRLPLVPGFGDPCSLGD